jgi:hypothetical protein
MRLIPNNITITEQLTIRKRIMEGIDKWALWRWPNHIGPVRHSENTLKILEKECGIQMHILPEGQTLYGFTMTNEKKYAWFLLRFQ